MEPYILGRQEPNCGTGSPGRQTGKGVWQERGSASKMGIPVCQQAAWWMILGEEISAGHLLLLDTGLVPVQPIFSAPSSCIQRKMMPDGIKTMAWGDRQV